MLGDRDLSAVLHAGQVPAEVVLQVPYADLDPLCGYIHIQIVAPSYVAEWPASQRSIRPDARSVLRRTACSIASVSPTMVSLVLARVTAV